MKTTIIALVAIFWSAGAVAGTLVVPTQYSSIQAAVDAAVAGDTVLVHPGTYVENPVVGIDLVLKSSAGPEETIIDGSQAATTTLTLTGPGPETIVEGFTIRGGSGVLESFGRLGGGVFIGLAPEPGPLLKDNWITGNQLTMAAGGVLGAGVLVASAGRLTDNKIYGNSIEGQYGGGAGVYQVLGDGMLVLERNEIFNNVVTTTEYGFSGGVYAISTLVRENLIVCNWAKFAAGIKVECPIEAQPSTIESNTIVFNRSVRDPLTATCEICSTHQSVVFRNNNVTHNNGYGLECVAQGGTFIIECNNFQANFPVNLLGDCDDAIGRDGNISVTPMYGAGGCEELPANSFCVSPESGLLPENSPPGCGLIGARGECPPIGIADAEPLPGVDPTLLGARPNPFAERTAMLFDLPEAAEVRVQIINARGGSVVELSRGRLPAGEQQIIWDGHDARGRRCAPGVYFARIRAGDRELRGRLLLLR